MAIVLFGGATAAAIVLTKHDEHSSETVTEAESEASNAGYEEEPAYEEEGEYEAEEEPGYEEEAETSASPAQAAQNQVQAALRAHFHRLAYANYNGAFQDLTASEQESAGGAAGWVPAQEEDQLEDFHLSVETSLLDSHSARATITEFQTRSVATGCNYWSGYWEMSKEYGAWLIAAAKLESEPC